MFRHANYSNVAVMGHSMGGNAAARIATMGEHEAYTLRAAVAENPALMWDFFTRPDRIKVPTFFETGTNESLCPERAVLNAYKRDPMPDKVIIDIVGGKHCEESNIGPQRGLPYSVQFLVCHLFEDEKACDLVYGQSSDSLCTEGNVEYAVCEAIRESTWNDEKKKRKRRWIQDIL